MVLSKLRQLDGNSAGVTMAERDLLLEGLIDENGQLVDEHHIHIQRIDDGQWTLELVEEIDQS